MKVGEYLTDRAGRKFQNQFNNKKKSSGGYFSLKIQHKKQNMETMSKFRLNSVKSLAERIIKSQISEGGKYFLSNNLQVKFCDLFVQSVIKKKKKKARVTRTEPFNFSLMKYFSSFKVLIHDAFGMIFFFFLHFAKENFRKF